MIRVIGRTPGISQRVLADKVGAPPNRMVALVGQGDAQRGRSAIDRRNYELRLTEVGTPTLAKPNGRLSVTA